MRVTANICCAILIMFQKLWQSKQHVQSQAQRVLMKKISSMTEQPWYILWKLDKAVEFAQFFLNRLSNFTNKQRKTERKMSGICSRGRRACAITCIHFSGSDQRFFIAALAFLLISSFSATFSHPFYRRLKENKLSALSDAPEELNQIRL